MNRKMLVLFLFCLFLPAVSAAVTTAIEVNDSFALGEEIKFDYTIATDTPIEVEFIASIDCPFLPTQMLLPENILLIPNQPYNGNESLGTVKETYQTQTCKAIVSFSGRYAETAEKEFLISTSPVFSFTASTCKDSACIQKSKVFSKGETVFLGFSSEEEGISVTGVLTLPDNSIQELSLPASFTAEQIGSYSLDLTASKEGFLPASKKEVFSVIEGNVTIPDAPVIPSDTPVTGPATPPSTPPVTPSDVPPADTGKEEPVSGFDSMMLVWGVIVLALIGAGVYFLVLKR